jgi:uncharacterized membrane protein
VRRFFGIITLALVALMWTSAIVFAATSQAPRMSAAVYAAGALVCHQRADRSFYVGDAQLPVCARCFGLYAGAVLGICAWAGTAGLRQTPSDRAARLVLSPQLRLGLAAAALPTLITVATAWAGVWDPGNAVRASLAVPLGAAIGAVVAAVAAGDLR